MLFVQRDVSKKAGQGYQGLACTKQKDSRYTSDHRQLPCQGFMWGLKAFEVVLRNPPPHVHYSETTKLKILDPEPKTFNTRS